MARRYAKPPDPNQHVGIADGGAEQMLLDGNVWRVLKPTGRYVSLVGPLAGRHIGAIFQVVSAAAKLIDELGQAYVDRLVAKYANFYAARHADGLFSIALVIRQRFERGLVNPGGNILETMKLR